MVQTRLPTTIWHQEMGPHPDWTRHTLGSTALPAVDAPLDGLLILLITFNCIIVKPSPFSATTGVPAPRGPSFVSVFFLIHSFVDRRVLSIVLHFLIE